MAMVAVGMMMSGDDGGNDGGSGDRVAAVRW